MSPEYKDEIGIIHWWNPELGVESNHEFSTNCRFFDEDKYVRVKQNWPGTNEDGREGWWVGTDEPIIGTGGRELTVPYQIVVWDGGHVSMVHERWLDKL